ncbi:hypothetical protein OIU84_008118 [Salix udensis]|uniref:Uncharacterized protein n=1 Tax=Salix udensis TaxID=889485 RepID=A0AAD6JW92_9ROSI|nr:hypothetical protein OIU84_008118 [Salix udensis]
MESSQIFVTEECHSSESGWTMYLGSPIQDGGGGGDDENSDDGDSSDGGGSDNKSYNDDSDDSMASDASSGPSHHGIAHLKKEQDKHVGEYQMEMKGNKPKENKKAESGRKEEKEAMAFMEKGADNASAQSGSKPACMGSKCRSERDTSDELLLMIMLCVLNLPV